MAASKIEAAPEAASQTQVRQRSTIGFPYMDLESAVELANAIHDHAGHGDCDDDQLAAWSGQSAKSSTFRVQVYAARTFGILEIENDRHKLTELGRAIVDPKQARSARVKAFIHVPLFKTIFDNHRSGVLPPTAALVRGAPPHGERPAAPGSAAPGSRPRAPADPHEPGPWPAGSAPASPS